MITQRQVPTTQKILKTVEIAQVQFINEVVGCARGDAMTGACDSEAHSTMENPLVQYVEMIVEFSLTLQRQVGGSVMFASVSPVQEARDRLEDGDRRALTQGARDEQQARAGQSSMPRGLHRRTTTPTSSDRERMIERSRGQE